MKAKTPKPETPSRNILIARSSGALSGMSMVMERAQQAIQDLLGRIDRVQQADGLLGAFTAQEKALLEELKELTEEKFDRFAEYRSKVEAMFVRSMKEWK